MALKKKSEQDRLTFTKSDFTKSDFTTLAVSGASAANTLVATAGQTRVMLTWTGASDTFNLSAYRVNYSTTEVPATYADGTILYQGTAVTTEQTGLSASVPYYYSLFTVDNTQDWSLLTTTTSAVATPFANSIYGTNVFPYKTGAQIRSIFIDEGLI